MADVSEQQGRRDRGSRHEAHTAALSPIAAVTDASNALASGASQASSSVSTSLSRGIEHLDQLLWMQAVALSALIRTALVHPLNVAIARKRVHRDFVTLREVLQEGYRSGGLRVLYRGLGVCALGNTIGECTYLSALEHVRHGFPSESSVIRDAVGGAAGDAVSLVACTPFSVVCNRQMTAGFGMAAATQYNSAVGTVRSLASSERGAIRSLYAGLSASLYFLPASALWWGTYGAAKHAAYATAAPFLQPPPDPASADGTAIVTASFTSSTDNPLINGTCGVLAACVTACATNPFNVIRTRLQVLDEERSPVGQHRSRLLRHSRMARVAADLVKHEGYRAFFKGLRVNAGVAALDGLMFSSVYEFTKWISDSTLHAAADAAARS